jgi:hypothetical protein
VLTLDQLSLVISQASAPAFILAAVASFLSVLISHMSRIIDRSRAINALPDGDPLKLQLNATLSVLKRRAKLINRAIYWAVASGISTCLLMITAFGSAYFGIRHEPGAAILFTLSLGLFTFALISFAREVRLAMQHVDFS